MTTPVEIHQSDDELVSSAACGNEIAFAELVGRHKRMIFRVVRRFFHKHEEIEEITHISFIEAWFALGSYRGGEAHSFAAWLSRIAVNSCYDELRRRRQRSESIISQLDDGEAFFLFERKSMDGPGSKIENELISRDLTIKMLNLLEPIDRRVFVMLKTEAYSVAEIAKSTGWSEAKVKMRIHRSRSILKRRSHRLM